MRDVRLALAFKKDAAKCALPLVFFRIFCYNESINPVRTKGVSS
jgi:hypothetical protein